MNIEEISKKDSICFLWCCEANLKEAIQILESWGFKYKMIGFIWVKTKDQGKKFVYNPGPWTGKCCEFCLIGTKGSVMKFVHNRPLELVMCDRTKHSEKPDEVRKRIESMFPKSSKIELFARKKFEGWDCFGNEVESDVFLNV